MSLNPSERELFNQLISSTSTLVVVCRNAAAVLSEEFEDMITGPVGVVEHVLAMCPKPGEVAWDHVFRQTDCTFTYFTPDVPDAMRTGRQNTGVMAVHTPTGESAQSYSSPDVEVNKTRAIKGLRALVERKHSAGG